MKYAINIIAKQQTNLIIEKINVHALDNELFYYIQGKFL